MKSCPSPLAGHSDTYRLRAVQLRTRCTKGTISLTQCPFHAHFSSFGPVLNDQSVTFSRTTCSSSPVLFTLNWVSAREAGSECEHAAVARASSTDVPGGVFFIEFSRTVQVFHTPFNPGYDVTRAKASLHLLN